MKEIIFSASGTALVLLTRDLYIICSRLLAKRKGQKEYQEYVSMVKESANKIREWLDESNPEDYEADNEIILQICEKCEKLKKSIIEEQDRNICLDCKIEE